MSDTGVIKQLEDNLQRKIEVLKLANDNLLFTTAEKDYLNGLEKFAILKS